MLFLGFICFHFLVVTNSTRPTVSCFTSYEEPVNGEQARVPFRWSWNEGWKTPMSLMPLCQPDKPVKPTSNVGQNLLQLSPPANNTVAGFTSGNSNSDSTFTGGLALGPGSCDLGPPLFDSILRINDQRYQANIDCLLQNESIDLKGG
jgi:hypothetical protein